MPPKRKAVASGSPARKKTKTEGSSTTKLPDPMHKRQTWAVFLRGVNVGNGNRITMDKLRACLERAGYGPVQTVVQSGNVVLRANTHAAAEDVREGVGNALDSLGLETQIILRSKAELQTVLEHDPHKDIADNQSKYLVHLFAEEPGDEKKNNLLEPFIGDADNRAIFHGRELYMWCPNGISKSPWFKIKFDKVLSENSGTARNWRTISAVAALM
ncbi:DUF1697-domain-containing protein [Auricularia subglabra TFB-10046 SS5]|nr:DUF1697-domain-containing protein [Auricularia subglabra TFB-10046 SS5]